MKKVCFIITFTVCCFLSGCISSATSTTSQASPEPADTPVVDSILSLSPDNCATPTPTPTGRQSGYGAWVPYWDYAGAIDELDKVGSSLDDIVCFAAIFNSSDKVYLLPETLEALTCLNILYPEDHTIYLSVVNDIETGEDVFDNKSTDLLWRLLGSDGAMETHIKDLMQMLQDSKAEGLEIDYEAIRSDTGLCARFALFIERLYQRTSAAEIPLRVVLSWDSALYATFPEGPQYSIMCYNLYGTHSGPGPKADYSFLTKAFQTNRALPGRPAIAFATGGFDWGSDGSIISLTQSAAVALQHTFGVPDESVSRDEASQALSFLYTDDLGLSHEVWYADSVTLSYWRSLALKAGYTNFDLFRLGGNSLSDLMTFFAG